VKVRATKRALALGGGALALFAVGTNVQAGWVLVIAALLGGVLGVGVIVPLFGSSGIEIGRRVPRTAVAGQRIAATMSVTNRSRRTRGLLAVFDEFCGSGTAVVGLLRPRETREYASRRGGARRGVYAGGECTVTSGAPFGVVRTRRTVDVASPIVVYPRTYDVSARDMLGLGAWRATAPIGDASSVRDYHLGDPLRHIHWRSVARRGQLVVREFDTEKRAEVTIVVEAADDPDVADAVASVACSLGLSFLRGAGEVRLIAGRGAEVHTSRVRDADSVLEWGARLDPSGAAFASVLDAAGSAPAVVCVCPASTSGAERLSRLAGDTSLLAVLVADASADDLAVRLRSAGAAVALVSPGEVEIWFRDGCVVS
jgi:uncharacterized protein (DUF58 family)